MAGSHQRSLASDRRKQRYKTTQLLLITICFTVSKLPDRKNAIKGASL
jgi:hypothetical protein